MSETKGQSQRRTERRLQKAFMQVVVQKGFGATSVVDIAERAEFSRGTFYVHYADKHALLDAVMRTEFRRALAERLARIACEDRLEQLTLAVLDILEGKFHHRPHQPPPLAEVETPLAQVIQEELALYLCDLLDREPAGSAQAAPPQDVTARIMSAAITGAAIQWSREPACLSAQDMARAVTLVLTDGIKAAGYGDGSCR